MHWSILISINKWGTNLKREQDARSSLLGLDGNLGRSSRTVSTDCSIKLWKSSLSEMLAKWVIDSLITREYAEEQRTDFRRWVNPMDLTRDVSFCSARISVELVNDLVNMTTTDESSAPRRASKMSVGGGSIVDETKSVKFASSTSATTRASSANKVGSSIMAVLTGAQPEEMNTIATIRTLLQYVLESFVTRWLTLLSIFSSKREQPESDEIVEPGTPAALGL